MICRTEILAYVEDKYAVAPDYPWLRTPNYAILRHRHNRKWFGAIVDITEDKLGLEGRQLVDVLNVKCDPLLLGALMDKPGFYPAYHMNKEYWISVLLRGVAAEEDVYRLLDLSYDLTK